MLYAYKYCEQSKTNTNLNFFSIKLLVNSVTWRLPAFIITGQCHQKGISTQAGLTTLHPIDTTKATVLKQKKTPMILVA